MRYGGIWEDESSKSAFYHDKCDKYDYLIAAGCGAIAGLVDVFFVGAPGDSLIQGWTDGQVDKTVMLFAKTCGWKPSAGQERNVKSAIGFLENGSAESRKNGFYGFKVNYDQRHSGDVGGVFNMSAKNHHMKSLAHSPDILGLFFSILNQFTSTASYLHDGQLITIQTETYELQGHDFVPKLFCGITNWFGHIMSDVAGSSGAVGRGSGVVIPFYELFQLCNFGSFQVGRDRNTLAMVATKVFQEGYDVRYALNMSIPVVLCDLTVKLIWAMKHYFYHKKAMEECIPTRMHDDLRIMLLIGNGTLCLMDGADAAMRSGGNWVVFFLRFNLVAWYRFVLLILREVCIRLGIHFPIQRQLECYIRINEALTIYLTQLRQYDYEKFRKETEQYNRLLNLMKHTINEYELNRLLKEECKALGLQMPYEGEFDDFMRDKATRLIFD